MHTHNLGGGKVRGQMLPSIFFYLRIVLTTELKRGKKKWGGGTGQSGRKGNTYTQDWFKPILPLKKNIFYYTPTMEIVHKTINNIKSVSISCFQYT
jgi:hypothetical protein